MFPVTAAQEAPAERGHPGLPGGLQGVQLRGELPVQRDQPGDDRRQRRKPGAGQPEEVHSVWSGGPGQQQRRDGTLLHRGGRHHAGGRYEDTNTSSSLLPSCQTTQRLYSLMMTERSKQ